MIGVAQIAKKLERIYCDVVFEKLVSAGLKEVGGGIGHQHPGGENIEKHDFSEFVFLKIRCFDLMMCTMIPILLPCARPAPYSVTENRYKNEKS